jgi:anti-sigma-K factor RskA
MPALLSMSSSMMVRYLLGDLTWDESQRIEKAIHFNYRLRRELEVAKEELTAAYVVGRLRGKDRLKFETAFLASEEGQRKIKFARAWIEDGGSARPDLTSPLHRYVLGDLPPDEVIEVEENLPCDENYRQRLDAAEDEVLIAYFHETLPEYGIELFDAHYLFNDRIVGKLRFAHIMYEYERASALLSPTPEDAMRASRRRLEKVLRRRPFHKIIANTP